MSLVSSPSAEKEQAVVESVPQDSENGADESVGGAYQSPLASSRAFWGYILLYLATGPTSGMLFNYATAAIQTVSNAVGHVPGSEKPCAVVGPISCVVYFGSQEVDYVTFILYINSITRALKAVFCILVSGVADYTRFRKSIMMFTIYLYGVLCLPWAGLTNPSYSTLYALSALYCVATVISGVFMIVQAAYIPMFMAAARGMPSNDSLGTGRRESLASWSKAARVSTWSMVLNNVGQVAAILVGIIISYAQKLGPNASINSYLLSITISGAVTIAIAVVGDFLLPGVPATPRPKDTNIILLPFLTCYRLFRAISSYPEAFKFCMGWALWDASWFAFIPLLSSLFLQTTGLNFAAGIYAVFNLVGIIAGVLASLVWMYLFPRVKAPVKSWLYVFLGLNIFCIFWGCLGISTNSAVGLKHPAEFWVMQVLFMSSLTAMLTYNRVLWASFIPKGHEALLSGLIFMLDLITGWVLPFLQGYIQNKTHDLHYPMLVSLALMVASVPFFVWVRVEKGTREAGKMIPGATGPG